MTKMVFFPEAQWECPDFFVLGGKGVLIVSPQEMRVQGLEFHNGNNVIALIGL